MDGQTRRAVQASEYLPWTNGERRWLVVLIIALLIWTFTDVRRRARIDPQRVDAHRTDITVYTGAGAAFFSGTEDPYEFASIRGWKYPYPPLFALCMAPLASLDSMDQAVVWCLVCLLMAFGSWYEVGRISRALGFDTRLTVNNATLGCWIGWLAMIAIALPVVNCLQRGQVGVTKLYFLMLGFRLMVEARSSWRMALGAGVFALPVAIKVTPALPLAILAYQALLAGIVRSDRTAATIRQSLALPGGAALGLAVYLLVIPGLLLGWNANLGYLATWYERVVTMASDVDPEGQVGPPYSVRNQSFSNAVYRLANWTDYTLAGGPDDRLVDTSPSDLPAGMAMTAPVLAHLITGVKILSLAVLALVATAAGLRRDRLATAAVLGLALVATMVVSPVSRGHYYMLILPALVWVPLLLARQRSQRWVLMTAAVPTALILLHYLGMQITGRMGVLGIGITLWYLVASSDVLLLLYRPAARRAAADAPQAEHASQRTSIPAPHSRHPQEARVGRPRS